MTRARAADRLILTVACAVTLAWVLAAVVTVGRGLDVTDEGFYLLSYRWWDSSPRTFTGAPYLYGPVYELLGYDVRGLRLFRLVTVLAAHLLLARSVLLWLRTVGPSTPGLTPGTAATCVLASGGVVYGWLPLSPGYNDVSVLGAVVLGAAVVRAHSFGRQGSPLPWSWAVMVGAVLTAMVLAKWTSAVLVVGLASLTVVLLAAERPPRLLRTVLTVVGTGLAALAGFHLLVVPLHEVVPPWWETTTLVASVSNSPGSLVAMYARTSLSLLPALILAVTGLLLHRWACRRGHAAGAFGAVMAVGVPVGGILLLDAGLRGGVGGTLGVASLLLITLTFGLWALWSTRETRPRGGNTDQLIVACLMLLPAAQAFGTGNSLYQMAVNAGALWVASIVMAFSQVSLSADLLLSRLVVVVTVVGLGWVAVDASVAHPYRTETFPAPTVVDTVATGPVRMASVPAAHVTALRDALDASDHVGRPYLAFDEMAGLVLLLDGRSVGEAWYSAVDPARTAAGIESDCPTLTSDPDGPVLLFQRPAGEEEVEALAACGLDFSADFTLLRVPHGPPSLAVYVPVDE